MRRARCGSRGTLLVFDAPRIDMRRLASNQACRNRQMIFGEETMDCQAAINAYYGRTDRSYDWSGFISGYATSHSWEDWAEQ